MASSATMILDYITHQLGRLGLSPVLATMILLALALAAAIVGALAMAPASEPIVVAPIRW